MFKKILLFLLLSTWSVCGYFTLPGTCPENVPVMEDFDLAEFHGKWHQTHYYSSDGQKKANCSTIELKFGPSVGGYPNLFFNQTRVDRGLFQRHSIAKVSYISSLSSGADFELKFEFENAPKRLKTRKYRFQVLATNYKYYATAYTCQYSPLIDKHFVYVWILSRNPILNDVSKELALRSLQPIGLDSGKLIKDDLSKCHAKYYEDVPVEPATFRYPVPI